MFQPRHSHPQGGNNPQHPHPPQPPSRGQMPPQEGRWQPPLFNDKDDELLREILGSNDEAESISNMLKQSPPEIAAIGYLVLRAFERSKS